MDKDSRLWWGSNGDRAPRLKQFLSEANEGILPTTLWADGEVFGLNQQGVREIRALGLPDFPTPKPERLIRKVIEIGTNPGDIVLDSFGGSGTTGAVAHKMARRWIMVELGEHCHTHILPRLNKVIDGEDPGGVTEATGWKGGGGLRYFHIAPSLLEKDRFGNLVISKQYNAAMLTEAMCKVMGFTYAPSDELYWLQGRSTENDFLFVTTQTLTREQLAKLSDEVGENRSLLDLLCCLSRESGHLPEPHDQEDSDRLYWPSASGVMTTTASMSPTCPRLRLHPNPSRQRLRKPRHQSRLAAGH